MQISNPTLYVEINNLEFNFFVSSYDENENLKINYKLNILSIGLDGNRIFDLEKVYNRIKENIFLIEQKLIIHLKK